MLFGKAKASVIISAILTKADGTVINLGVVGNTNENWFQKQIRRLKNKFNILKQNFK